MKVIPLTIKACICALKNTAKYLMEAAFQYQSINKHMIIMELLEQMMTLKENVLLTPKQPLLAAAFITSNRSAIQVEPAGISILLTMTLLIL